MTKICQDRNNLFTISGDSLQSRLRLNELCDCSTEYIPGGKWAAHTGPKTTGIPFFGRPQTDCVTKCVR